MKNQVVWVDIPVGDLDRAVGFYSAVLSEKVTKFESEGVTMAFLPGESGEVSGCLYQSEEFSPSENGLLVYFNCDGRLEEAVAAVRLAGGRVLVEPQAIGPHGFRAIVHDTEGNRIALHSH